ncbi:YihY/virulence factor BrkB family protein [Noviherbaspirillum aridicola]|uniref:YihY/virulence factor BrkB family protein n=1 Tax=Noviherbaspirillum aridicola TaxID=2849687 RepID=A0ABQ4Q000_9BURK|nr:YihY/virulence factor BrkB family protein [Noviherbaspirillum aridicola]GIZ50468.1 hypothetical protein NCCP691_04820 [Noviherbaspirillum aridicola]
MKQRDRYEPGKLVTGAVQVAVAVVSFLEWRRRAKGGQPPRAAGAQQAQVTGFASHALHPASYEAFDETPDLQQAENTKRDAEAQEVERKKRETVARLHGESRPKAMFHLAISAAKEWSSHRAASKGAALALYTLFSLAPMLVLVVTIAGLFFGEDNVRNALLQQMSGLMGEQGGDAVRTILEGARREDAGLIAGLISFGLVLLSATSAFSELKASLDELWEVPPAKTSGVWGFIRDRVLSFGLILVLALMLLISLAVSTAISAMDSIWPGGEGSPLKIISMVLSHLVSFGIVAGLFAVIFKYLPGTEIAWKDVAVGAAITAVLFIIGKTIIGMYVASADISSGYGAAGSVVILITWVYYSAQIFFYGALFTHEYAVKLGSRSQPRDTAREARGEGLRPETA